MRRHFKFTFSLDDLDAVVNESVVLEPSQVTLEFDDTDLNIGLGLQNEIGCLVQAGFNAASYLVRSRILQYLTRNVVQEEKTI